jgi:hypothetical protein
VIPENLALTGDILGSTAMSFKAAEKQVLGCSI